MIGAFRDAAAPIRPAALYIAALALVPPFLNPVTFFPSDVPRLLLYTVPVAIPLAITALRPPGAPMTPAIGPRGRLFGRIAGGLALLCAVAPLVLVDRYRRADLTGARDGPLVLAAAHETLRTARRLARGEEVVLDPAERRFVWGESHASEMDRMRWFLRDGWGQRAHYGTGEVTMHEPRATLLLPVLEPRAMTAEIHAQAPRTAVLDAAVNGRLIGSWAVGPDSGPQAFAVPAEALFRGDNEVIDRVPRRRGGRAAAAGGLPVTVYTIGHSTRSIGELVALLEESGIRRLLDVRRFPGSRRHPQFARDALSAALAERGIAYGHEPDLGGMREPRPDSPNTAWRVAAFRGYADHMASPEFRAALGRVRAAAAGERVAVMCAEAVPWRCHRQLVADALVAAGDEVRHVLGPGDVRPHALHPSARPTAEGLLVYPGDGAHAQATLFGAR